MKTIFTLSLVLASLALAEVRVSPASGKVLLEAKKCEEIQSFVPANWLTSCAKKIGGSWFSASLFSSSPCQYEVSACVPKVVSELHGLKAQVNGLNGWNLGLFMSGIHPVLRTAPAEEFKFFMHSPLCHLLAEAPQVGDILALRDADGDEVGATIYLSENLVFAKVGSKTHDMYLVQSKAPVEAGTHHVDTYHCDSFETYLQEALANEPKLQAAHLQLTAIEKKLAHVLPVKVSINAAEELEIKTQVQGLIDLYFSKLAQESSQAKFLHEALKVRLKGLAEHLKVNAKSVTSSEVETKQPIIEMIEAGFAREGVVPVVEPKIRKK
jgi:hypothetical protein